jgi:hypothetical protein
MLVADRRGPKPRIQRAPPIMVWFGADQRAALDAYCDREGLNMAQAVRQAVKLALDLPVSEWPSSVSEGKERTMVQLSEDQTTRLVEVAKEAGLSMTEAIRRAVSLMLQALQLEG